MPRIHIARDFSTTPGARYRTDGPASGEQFREEFLEPLFHDPDDDSVIEVLLDGAEGYATSFLEEAFGGLARKYGVERCLKRIRAVSTEEPLLADEVRHYIEKATQVRK